MISDEIKGDRLRKEAEGRVKKSLDLLKDVSLDKTRTLLHELEVHQIELEMQNQELRETRDRLELLHDEYVGLFDFAPIGYLVLDKKGIVVNINLTACDFLGVERAFIKGKPFSAFASSGESRKLFLKLKEAYKTGQFPEFELVMNHKTKGRVIILLKGKISNKLKNNDNVCHISFQDVTEAKEAQEIIESRNVLQKEKDRIRQYLDAAPLVFLLLDRDNKIQMINQKGCKLLNAGVNEIVGKKCFDGFICDLDVNRNNDIVVDGVKKLASLPTHFECKLSGKSGESFIMSWSNVPLFDDDGNHVGNLMAGENITQRKILELSKEEYTKNLENLVSERTNKLTRALRNEKRINEMKTAFVSMASHEFRTPLTSILTSAILLKKYNNQEQYDKQGRHIERIKSSVKQLTDILEDFLSIDKLERSVIKTSSESFNIRQLVQEIRQELDWSLKEKQQINYNHIGNAQIHMDRKILRNIFINLITNALKFSKSDVILNSEVTVDGLNIAVIDKGIGIPEGDVKHLFSKFFRAKNAANIQGTGLGLTIVKHYVNLLHGEIIVESQLGEGTQIYLKFPFQN